MLVLALDATLDDGSCTFDCVGDCIEDVDQDDICDDIDLASASYVACNGNGATLACGCEDFSRRRLRGQSVRRLGHLRRHLHG